MGKQGCTGPAQKEETNCCKRVAQTHRSAICGVTSAISSTRSKKERVVCSLQILGMEEMGSTVSLTWVNAKMASSVSPIVQ